MNTPNYRLRIFFWLGKPGCHGQLTHTHMGNRQPGIITLHLLMSEGNEGAGGAFAIH